MFSITVETNEEIIDVPKIETITSVPISDNEITVEITRLYLKSKEGNEK